MRGAGCEWYANGPLGLEQGFDVAHRPAGTGRLMFALSLSGDLRAQMNADGVVFSGHGASLRYAGLLATDARGRRLPASVKLSRSRLVVSVDDRSARYPVRVDPFVQAAELNAGDGAGNNKLGRAVAISGNTIVVDAPVRQVGANADQGALYVFVEPAGGWANATQAAELTASDGASGDNLGDSSVAIDGNTIVAGAAHHGTGAAYVWVEPAGGWASEPAAPDATQTAELIPSGATGGGYLPVAISSNTIVLGAPDQTVGGNVVQGAVYVWTMPAGGWATQPHPTQTAELTASNGASNDEVGLEVGISGSTVVASAQLADEHPGGAVYVWTMPPAGWASTPDPQAAELTATGGYFRPGRRRWPSPAARWWRATATPKSAPTKTRELSTCGPSRWVGG
jgi:hypothetical protein